MLRYDPPHRLLAIALAILAGYVDAVGFMVLGGLFVSFMSGNTTNLSVDMATGASPPWLAAGLIVSFLGGVVAGALGARWRDRWRKPCVLALTTLLLAAAAAGPAALTPFLMAAAMGCANGVFQREGEVSVGVTYMTGTLVKIGQHLAAALSGGPGLAWLPYLLLWLGLAGGAAAGALGYSTWGLAALWVAVAAAALLTIAAVSLARQQSLPSRADPR